jgi:DNA polymerase III subunit alpha
MLDGVGTAEEHVKRAVEIGAEALALTDHGSLSGSLHHLKACHAAGIKPIVGIEAYFREDRLDQRPENRTYFHLLLLAKTLEGWHNLMRLSTEAWASGFYHKPCVDWELLRKHSKGVIATTSCLSGLVVKRLLGKGDPELALRTMRDVFGDELFVELQPHAIPEQVTANVELVNLAGSLGVGTVATTDAHYPYREWSDTHDVLVMSRTGQSVKTRAKAEERGEDYMAFSGDTFFLMSRAEVMREFKRNHPNLPRAHVEAAVDGAVDIAASVEAFEVDKTLKVPVAKQVLGDAELLVRDWCEEGLVRVRKKSHPVYRKRMEREIRVLRNAGVMDYIAIIGDMVRWAKSQGILVGAGRGSAAGSLVAYLSRITAIDPIGHGLLFERFLNEDRKEMPDIDIDFQHNRRQEVVDYLKRTWGADHVANVAAFQTFGMRTAIQASARVLCVPYEDVTSVTKTFEESVEQVSGQEGEGDVRLEHIVTVNEKLKKFSKDYPLCWKHALRLEGQVKAQGKHPAGVVITDKALSEYMPTQRSSGGQLVTAWSERASFPIITEFGFLKIDVLALDDLTIKAHAAEVLKQTSGEVLDFDSVKQFRVIEDPRAVDPEVIAAFGDMHNLGVFQFESRGISALLKDIEPDWLGDITAANALYRPGTIEGGLVWSYAKRKSGEEKWKYVHPSMAEHLDETYGIIVYQEQVMQIAQEIGGFTPSEADEVRKVMTKWHSNKLNTRRGERRMRELSGKFFSHAMERKGLNRAEAAEVWHQLQSMTRYGFNKSHSAGYALGAYQDKWLKLRRPLAMYAAMLTWEPRKKLKIVREAMAAGVKVLPPDVNESVRGFSVHGDALRFGLDSIRDVGAVAVHEIVTVRQARSYADIDDFRARTTRRKCNSKVVTALEEAGAFDSVGGRHGWDVDRRAEAERRRVEVPLSFSRLSRLHHNAVRDRVHRQDEIEKMQKGDTVTVGGEVVEVREIVTKRKRERMAFVTLAFGNDEYRVTFFPRQYAGVNGELVIGKSILVMGTLDREQQVLVNEFCSVEELLNDTGA